MLGSMSIKHRLHRAHDERQRRRTPSRCTTPAGANAILMPWGSSEQPRIQPPSVNSAVSAMPATAVGSANGRSTIASSSALPGSRVARSSTQASTSPNTPFTRPDASAGAPNADAVRAARRRAPPARTRARTASADLRNTEARERHAARSGQQVAERSRPATARTRAAAAVVRGRRVSLVGWDSSLRRRPRRAPERSLLYRAGRVDLVERCRRPRAGGCLRLLPASP